MPFWFDPVSLALVLLGTAVVSLLRCGWSETRGAVLSALALAQPAFDRVEAKAELAKQVREIADDGFVRAEAHHIGDGEFDTLADLLISRRSIDALMAEHERYKRDRADAATRAARVFDAATESGPIMGLAGTLIALASQRGGGSADLVGAVGMAVLTTLYGLLVANLLYAPLSAAITRRNAREEQDREAVLAWLGEGIRRIQARFVDDRPSLQRMQHDRQGASGWQTTTADLALILFLVVSAAAADRPPQHAAAVAPGGTTTAVALAPEATPAAAVYRPTRGTTLTQWLRAQTDDHRQVATVVVTRASVGPSPVVARGLALLDEIEAAGRQGRLSVERGSADDVAVTLAYDREPGPGMALAAR